MELEHGRLYAFHIPFNYEETGLPYELTELIDGKPGRIVDEIGEDTYRVHFEFDEFDIVIREMNGKFLR